MTHVACRLLLAAVALPMGVMAQTIPVDDFSKHAEVFDVSMAPDGKHVAISVPTVDGTESHLQIVPLDGSGKTTTLRFGRQQHVRDLIWTDDDQVVVARAKIEPLQTTPYSQGELMASDLTGKQQETLFAYIEDDGMRTGRRKDEGSAELVRVLDGGQILVEFTNWWRPQDQDQETTVFRVDSRSGKREQIDHVEFAANFAFDGKARARLRRSVEASTGKPIVAYRPKPDSDWTAIPRTLAGYDIWLMYVEADDDTAYALISDGGEPRQLYRVSLANGTRTKLAGRDDIDFGHVLREGRYGAPFGVIYDAARPSVQYLDPKSEWAGLHAGLMKAFPGQLVNVIDASRDGKKVLIRTWGDRNPVAYYVFDRNANQLQLINESMPWIQAARMAPSTPVSFTARDGLTLYGLYTAPAGSKGPLPLVVMPHGGPHQAYDAWAFSDDAQFFASRGYAVLQVNFRGSDGRGWNFMRSGFGEWGGKIMDDIADGVRWAIDNQKADPARICTYGASFGGYAALMNPIRYPELYRCAIGYVGVYDLPLMKKVGDVRRSVVGREYLDRALGADNATLIAQSPAHNAGKIKVPVMLVQGGSDFRVPMDQFDAMVDGFRKAGVNVETMVVKGEGHGFYKPENRAELYRRIEAFLARNLGSGTGSAPAAK